MWTISGLECQAWSSQSPHTHDRTPEDPRFEGLGDHNFCRNPDGEETIWCYTTDSGKRWEYCESLDETSDEQEQEEEEEEQEQEEVQEEESENLTGNGEDYRGR